MNKDCFSRYIQTSILKYLSYILKYISQTSILEYFTEIHDWSLLIWFFADTQSQAKRKVFSRLGKAVSKSKNISINLKKTTSHDIKDEYEKPAVKNENEVELDKRILGIRERNAEILRRQREIEEDIKQNS